MARLALEIREDQIRVEASGLWLNDEEADG